MIRRVIPFDYELAYGLFHDHPRQKGLAGGCLHPGGPRDRLGSRPQGDLGDSGLVEDRPRSVEAAEDGVGVVVDEEEVLAGGLGVVVLATGGQDGPDYGGGLSAFLPSAWGELCIR